MDPSQLYLRSTSAVSLHKRFSLVLMDQLTCSRTRNPVPVDQQRISSSTRLVRRVKEESPILVKEEVPDVPVRVRKCLRKRRSVWTRLGWRKLTFHLSTWRPPRLSTRRPRGFWSFRNKYRWRARCSWSKRGGPGRRRLLRTVYQLNRAAGRRRLGLILRRTRTRTRSFNGAHVPTRKKLDAQLDRYMSLSRTRLDQDLEDYMSMSRRRLDAELDQYMLMAGQPNED